MLMAMEGGPAQVCRQSFCFLSTPLEAQAQVKEYLPHRPFLRHLALAVSQRWDWYWGVRGGGEVTAVRQ